MPKYHPKSNKGRFSKKQKKASRFMMSARRGFRPQQPQGLQMPDLQPGFLAGLLSFMKLGRRRSAGA